MIQEVTDPKEIWKLEPLFRDSTELDETVEERMSKCVLGHYKAMAAYEDDKPVGVAVWYPVSVSGISGMFMVFVSARNNVRRYHKEFLGLAKDKYGCKFWRAWTHRNIKAYCRFFNARPLSTLVEASLEDL